jgi:hypothetical protein
MVIQCILLHPKIVQKSKEEGRKFDWAISLANSFYVKGFNVTFKDMCCIDMALLFDPTTMIVGHPLCANEVPGFSKTISCTKDVVVILAITFVMEQGMNVAHHMWFGCWRCHHVNQNHFKLLHGGVKVLVV